MQLTNSQNKVVEKIVSKYDIENKKIIEFQAPTGSGKTFMILNVIDKLIQQNPHEKFCFVIITLSAAKLPKQMHFNFLEYKQYLINKDLEIEHITSPSSSDKSKKFNKDKDRHYQILAKQNKILIFGNQSFGQKRIFSEEGIIDSFLSQIENEEFKLVYIRDEAHLGGEIDEKKIKFLDLDSNANIDKLLAKTKDASVHYEVAFQKNAHFIIKMTATPKGHNELISLTENDLKEDDILLLKKNGIYNEKLDEIQEETITNKQILEVACKKFKFIKDRYADVDKEPTLKNINPAMLIQVNNKDASNKEIFDANINEILEVLKAHNLNYVKYFGEDDIDSNIRLNSYSLNAISKNSSDVDVVIFKLGPATGWNIPRACMLVQLRNVSSASLSIQTLGRIKRNPNPNEEAKQNSISFNYYYYSNVSETRKNHINIFLKDQYKNETFKVGYIDKQEIQKMIQNENYVNELIRTLDINLIKDEYEKYKNEYQKYGYIPIYTEHFGKKKVVTDKISNSIDLEIFKENFLSKNKMYFSSGTIQAIENFKYNDFKRQNTFGYDDFSINLFWLIIAKNYLSQIKDIFYTKVNKETNSNKAVYKIKTNHLLPERTDFFVDDLRKHMINLPFNEYAYLNKNEEGLANNQYFDSATEEKFISLLKDYEVIELTDEYKIKVWTKNPVFQGIFLEYFNSDNEILKAYPDFIFRIIDKNDEKKYHDFYIEIKSLEDIDEKKTKMLIKSYKRYINKKEINLFEDNNFNITLLLLKLNKNKTNDVQYYGASFNEEINNILNSIELNAKNSGIGKLKDFFKLSILNN
ncbi:Type III restriction modification system endonuclease subunit, Res [Metamycoplasma auris 15026]|uniref:Type III restriction modification system endonuclease subunit, Res n=1 Tax=Metamycoplasma auris 15026 TaxID=1188233 RepID=N9V1N7_9BACT|nr:Type III restriction modification system endonuclease subunit, Res [Metamycoplasma auris 15026]